MTPAALAALNGRHHAFDWAPPLYVYVYAEEAQSFRDAGYEALGPVGDGRYVAMFFAPTETK